MTLFQEFAASFERGQEPDVRAYLERAGGRKDDLAELLDRWLRIVPAPAPSEEAVAEARSWLAGDPPLVALRSGRGLTRDSVVDFLIERFRLPSAKRDKVRRYYHEVETGQLAPNPRIREALALLLGGPIRSWKPRPLEAEPAYFRTRALGPQVAPAPAAEEWDEVDELFSST